jgi:hypothetical protein
MTRKTDTMHTRPDGSIDTAFYIARGRQMRSEAAHSMVRSDVNRPRRGLLRMFGTI